MARSMQADFLQNMRFHVTATQAGGGPDPLQPGGLDGSGGRRPDAGFTAVTAPELNIESVVYREGTMIYERKQPGVPTMGGDITMSRGVARQDGAFYLIALNVAEGGGEYRSDLTILHYHRGLSVTGGGASAVNFTNIDVRTAIPARRYRLFNAFCMRFKVAADLDATSSDISVAETDWAFESFTVEEVPVPAAA